MQGWACLFLLRPVTHTHTHPSDSTMSSECDDPVFPGTLVRGRLDPGDAALRALPTAATLLLWLASEARASHAKVVPRDVLIAAQVVALLGVGAAAALTWRVFGLLACNGDVDDATSWGIVAVVGVAFVDVALVLLGRRAARLVTLVFLLQAAGCVVAEWLLRGGLVDSPAAHPLPALQGLLCTVALILLLHRPRPFAVVGGSTSRRVWHDQVDVLARRDASGCAPVDRVRPWFAV